MPVSWNKAAWRARLLVSALACLVLTDGVLAQQPDSPQPEKKEQPPPPGGLSSPQTGTQAKPPGTPHRFWDKQNRWLFAGVAAMRAMDGVSTRNFRARGRSEGLLNNDIVDNAPAFATIELAGTVASIATSYWAHRTNHHKIERWVSYVHIGVGFFGDVRNYALPSIHRPPSVP